MGRHCDAIKLWAFNQWCVVSFSVVSLCGVERMGRDIDQLGRVVRCPHYIAKGIKKCRLHAGFWSKKQFLHTIGSFPYISYDRQATNCSRNFYNVALNQHQSTYTYLEVVIQRNGRTWLARVVFFVRWNGKLDASMFRRDVELCEG